MRAHASTHGGRETARRRPSEGTDSTGSVPRYPPPLYMYKSLSMFTLLRVHASTHGGFLDSDDETTPTRTSAYFVRAVVPPTLCHPLFFGAHLSPRSSMHPVSDRFCPDCFGYERNEGCGGRICPGKESASVSVSAHS